MNICFAFLYYVDHFDLFILKVDRMLKKCAHPRDKGISCVIKQPFDRNGK